MKNNYLHIDEFKVSLTEHFLRDHMHNILKTNLFLICLDEFKMDWKYDSDGDVIMDCGDDDGE